MTNLRVAPLLLLALLLLAPFPALAWQLSPEGTTIERKLASQRQSPLDRFLGSLALSGVHVFGSPVHEEITNRIMGCEGDAVICGDPDYDPDNAYFLAGVRWNDDPPFLFGSRQGRFKGCAAGQTVRFTTQPLCWANTFNDGKTRASDGVKLDGATGTMLVRSHFGDLQFLHAMASADGEPPETTLASMLAWSEFVWRMSLGEFSMEDRVVNVDVPGFRELFKHNQEWRIQDLFALGNPHIRSKEALSKVAFGSLLHMVQDSFAAGHVERLTPILGSTCANLPAFQQPGKIVEFHSYALQDSDKHGNEDKRGAFAAHWAADRPGVIDVGRTLRQLRDQKAPWPEAKTYLQCVFALNTQTNAASAGKDFALEEEQ